MNPAAFSNLTIDDQLLNNLDSLEYTEMTAIQAQSLPLILDGKDILAQAKTGSGKTVAFAIGLLNKLDVTQYKTQALVLCPTRELADQVSQEIRRLARMIANIKLLTLCGGKPMAAQLASLQHAPHIVVGTPGRILKHLTKGTLDLEDCQTLVLDEADRMLDMGFYDDIIQVIDQTPEKRQTLLFSATYPTAIKKISSAIQQDPADVRIEDQHNQQTIKQIFYEIERSQRDAALIGLLKYYRPESSLIFCNQKQDCKDLVKELRVQGLSALALHGDLEQKERDQVFVQFSNQSCAILIATDVASRGLDIKKLAAVFNYQISPDPEIHIHRIGRTGRADNEGLALSLFSAADAFRVNAIEDYLDCRVPIEKLPKMSDTRDSKIDYISRPKMVTLSINAGRKNKIRAADILGALTKNTELNGSKKVGKITIFDNIAYLAVEQEIAAKALQILNNGKIKGRQFNVRRLRNL